MEQATKGKQSLETKPPKKKLGKIKEHIKKLPDKKAHLDFIAALLSIPVLLTVLALNVASLQTKNNNAKITPVPTQPTAVQPINTTQQKAATPIVITQKPQPTVASDTCIRDIGPIDIASPQENETITDNPVCIHIDYHAGNYCGVVWAYSINHGPLSDYSNNSVCLYNLPSGKNNFLLQVKSLVSSSTQTLERNFIYNSPNTPTPTVSPTMTPAQSQ